MRECTRTANYYTFISEGGNEYFEKVNTIEFDGYFMAKYITWMKLKLFKNIVFK